MDRKVILAILAVVFGALILAILLFTPAAPVVAPGCGNGVIDAGETPETCCFDAGCLEGVCTNNVCTVYGKDVIGNSFEVPMAKPFYLELGKTATIAGTGLQIRVNDVFGERALIAFDLDGFQREGYVEAGYGTNVGRFQITVMGVKDGSPLLIVTGGAEQ